MNANIRGLLAAYLALASAAATGAELTVRITDPAGRAVENAVVSLTGKAGPAPRTNVPVIDQAGKQFRPWVLATTTGSGVAFSNHDDITHHIYSFSPAKRFSFRLQSGEEHAPIRFDAPGVVVLGCNIHDWMVGYVHVTDADYTATTDAGGEARFAVPAGEWKVDVWHPGLDGDAPQRGVTLGDARPFALDIRLEHVPDETGPREPLDDSGYALP